MQRAPVTRRSSPPPAPNSSRCLVLPPLLLIVITILACLPAATLAAHFELGNAYRYRVRSTAVSSGDVERTLLGFGASPGAQETNAATSYTFNADFEIAAYNVTAGGNLLCRLTFLATPEMLLGSDPKQPHHDGSGRLDFHNGWFGFVLQPDGIVESVVFDPQENPSILQIKRGLVGLFSAPVTSPLDGPKRRSFTQDEPGQFGNEIGTYDVQEDPKTGFLTYKREPSVVRRGEQEDTQVHHLGEKTLTKDPRHAHFLSISVTDRTLLKAVGKLEKQGMQSRDTKDETDTTWDTLISSVGSSVTEFVSVGPALHVEGPPEGRLATGSVFPPPATQDAARRPLKFVMPPIRKCIFSLHSSTLGSETFLHNGDKLKCFSDARRALDLLSAADAVDAAEFLMSEQNLKDALWIGFDLIGEMCSAVPVLLEHLLAKAYHADASDELIAGLAMKACFKCTVPTGNALLTVKSVVIDHVLPGETKVISSTTRDHSALLLGYMGKQLREQNDLVASAEITQILTTALDEPSAKHPRRSDDVPEASEASPDSHFHEPSIAHSFAAARRATLIHALGHTEDPSSVKVFKSAIFDNQGETGYHPVVRQAALTALGKLNEREAEDALLVTLSSDQHVSVHRAALRALRRRGRDFNIEQIADGAEELQVMYQANGTYSGPLSEPALRARDVVAGLTEVTLAAPPYLADKKIGGDVAGVRLQVNLVNQVHMTLSLLKSAFNVTIDHVAAANLYFDLGGNYQEVAFFEAELQFAGDISYNQDVFRNFRVSDVGKLSEILMSWVMDIQKEFAAMQSALQASWATALLTLETLKITFGTVKNTDWSPVAATLNQTSADADVLAMLDLFKEMETNMVDFGANGMATFIATMDNTKQHMAGAIAGLLGGFDHVLDCPEQAVLTVLAAVTDIHQTTETFHSAFEDLGRMVSISSLYNLRPEMDVDFADYVNVTLAAFADMTPLVELARASEILADQVDRAMNAALSTFTEFRSQVVDVLHLYNKLKGLSDATFGPKAHSLFPRTPMSLFPAEIWSDAEGNTYQGMGVQTSVGQVIVAPYAGKATIMDSTTVRIAVYESTLETYQVFVHNIVPSAGIKTGMVVKKGDPIAQASGSFLTLFICGGRTAKSCLDPRKYLPRDLPLKSPFNLSANHYSLRVKDQAIVPVTAIIKRGTPNAADVIDIAVPESPQGMMLYKFTQQFMVAGFIPVTFFLEFDAVMGIRAQVDLCLFDLNITPTFTPHFAIQMTGGVSLGLHNLASADLTAVGTVTDARVPTVAQLSLAQLPAGVCFDLNVIMVPLSMHLAIGVTLLAVYYSVTMASFAMAPVAMSLFDSCPADGVAKPGQPGFLVDLSGPLVSDTTAYQVPDHAVTTPFVFARFACSDPESGIESLTIGLGWSPGDTSIVAPHVMARDQGDSLAIPIVADKILDEQTLYVNVWYRNRQNLTTTSATPVFFDLSPPALAVWNDQTHISAYVFSIGTQNPRAILRKNNAYFTTDVSVNVNGSSYSGVANRLCFYYLVSDGSPQQETKWAIGTGRHASKAANIVNWTLDATPGGDTTTACATLPLAHGQMYFLNVATKNVLGYSTSTSSTPTLVDLTPPTAGRTFFGTRLGQTMNGTAVNSTAYFNFIDFTDKESDIAYWRFAIGPSDMDPGAREAAVTQWQPFKPWSDNVINEGFKSYVALSIDNLSMPEGNHTLCIQSTNFVGLSRVTCTPGYIVDQTPPTGTASLSVDSSFNLTVNFTYDDNLSSVQTVMVGLGDAESPYLAEYIELQVGDSPQFEYTFAGTSAMQGQIVYGLLIIVDYASNSLFLPTSNSLLIDMVPPVPGTVLDGANPTEDMDWIGSADNLCSSWSAWSSNVTTVGGYDLCFGSAAGVCDLVPWKAIGFIRSACLALPAVSKSLIADGVTIYSTVRGYNGINSTNSTATSTGMTLDMTPPGNFTVRMETSSGLPFVNDVSQTSIHWSPSVDRESGIEAFTVALFSQSDVGMTLLHDYAIPDLSNPQGTTATIRSDTSLVNDGDSIFACVQAINNAGLATTRCSDPVTLDLGRPTLLSCSYAGNNVSSMPFYVVRADSLDFMWTWAAGRGSTDYACELFGYDRHALVTLTAVADASGCHISGTSGLQNVPGNRHRSQFRW
ncbi:hypothetical protein BDZ88DRAFT_83538 [Geranomyces variabilis]|nr:hypothetical protein BDZ88DRAFT_83538 [Geranomyces variabilis]